VRTTLKNQIFFSPKKTTKTKTLRMTRLLTLALCLASFSGLALSYDSKGHCVWYDVCGADPDPPNPMNPHCLNCNYNGSAIQLDKEFDSLLDEACPHLRKDLDGDLRLCCSPKQLQV
jgi:hypothetical protein